MHVDGFRIVFLADVQNQKFAEGLEESEAEVSEHLRIEEILIGRAFFDVLFIILRLIVLFNLFAAIILIINPIFSNQLLIIYIKLFLHHHGALHRLSVPRSVPRRVSVAGYVRSGLQPERDVGEVFRGFF